MAKPAGADLAGLVAEAATALGIEPVDGDGGMAYRVAGAIVVVVEEGEAEFRLGAEIAAAAARTPHASPSPRGPEWVAFSPATLDRFTRDRVAAWFGFAVREAGG